MTSGPHTDLADGLGEWFTVAARDLPWRHRDAGAWGVLVSEVMLQQTPVARVLPVYLDWLARWPAPTALAAESPGEAVRAWGRLGYPRRALRLHACAVTLVDRHGGEVPDDVAALLALPGIGTYTAHAVAAFAFGRRVPVVDTNVRRVIARAVGGRAEAGAATTADDLAATETVLPHSAERAARTSAALMELGALVCVARAPRCEHCPICDHCAWNRAGKPANATGGARRAQGYAGSDRQVRGILLRALRESEAPLPGSRLDVLWHEAVQRDRALHSLVADGLVVRLAGERYALPA